VQGSVKAAAQFGRLVHLEPRLLGLLVRTARGEIARPDLEVHKLVGPVSSYRFTDGRQGPVTIGDVGVFEVVPGNPELTSVEALDVALLVLARARPQQQQERAA
jgi:hypothetical protein